MTTKSLCFLAYCGRQRGGQAARTIHTSIAGLSMAFLFTVTLTGCHSGAGAEPPSAPASSQAGLEKAIQGVQQNSHIPESAKAGIVAGLRAQAAQKASPAPH